jgi:hypothetical protein
MARIKLQLKGVDEMLERIKNAGGDIDSAAHRCISQSAQVMQDELQAEMRASGVDGGLVSRMPQPEISVNGNRYAAKVGHKMGDYNPDDPSDGFKALFWNFGTPNRTKHGKVAAHGYVARAKKNASPKIKKMQQQTLQKILDEVGK